MTLPTTYATSAPRQATFIVYINGLEVPAKSVSLRYGVWQTPEMQIEMVADPVLVRLGAEDRVQVAVFYLDDCDVDPSVKPEFRLFGEGEITGWGYRNTSSARSIVFTVVSQIAIFDQLFVQFMTTLDDMIAHETHPGDVTGYANASSQLVYPYALFNQGLLPGTGPAPARITRPFDFLYNTVKGMMASVVPDATRTVPAANFFTRWARLTNFHNRFAGSPFFDETFDAVNNVNVFPVLDALQSTAAIDVVIKNLMPNLQNTGSMWAMLQLVFGTMLMEVAMIPGMPLVSVDLATGLVKPTDFAEHTLVPGFDPANPYAPAWVPALPSASRQQTPKRLQNFFPKPQMLFSIPPSCNVVFPSQLLTIAYDEAFVSQPTRLYFNDEVLTTITKTGTTGTGAAIQNALAIAWPPEADQALQAQKALPKFNGKNFLLYPEEFFKGPVMDRRTAPPWLQFLKGAEQRAAGQPSSDAPPALPSDNPAAGAAAAPPPAQTAAIPRPTVATPTSSIMVTQSENGRIAPNGQRVYRAMTERLRPQLEAAGRANGIPSEFLLTWVNMESGGNWRASDGGRADVAAKGIFQLTPQECATLGVDWHTLLGDASTATSIEVGVRYILKSRERANLIARNLGLAWSEADMWRLTKFATHNLPAYAAQALPHAVAVLGRAPRDWAEFYATVIDDTTSVQRKALNNATAVGTMLGASGTMVSDSDPVPFTAGAVFLPPTGRDASASRTVDAAAPAGAPTMSAAAAASVAHSAEDVFHLYAKFEYFRERYAKRSGAATVVWNPYVVPGFPGAIFDQRASRVDLLVYITSVQHTMSHGGQRGTTLSFLYGRQFQEMFGQLTDEFARNDATARGTAPQEPIRAISKITQSFVQAETYYQRLFYGAQPRFDKDAAFDFRKIIGLEASVPGGAPQPIYVDGPDVATQDLHVAAAQTVATLTPLRAQTKAQLLDVQARLTSAQAAYLAASTATNAEVATGVATSSSVFSTAPVASADSEDGYATAPRQARADARATIVALTLQVASLTTSLASLDARLTNAIALVESTVDAPDAPRVSHNLAQAAIQPLVPLPTAQALFDSRDAAMRYNWRPICTLDEYVVFYNSAATGPITATGASRSVGARFFERIRTLAGPPPGYQPPTGIDGLGATGTIAGLSPDNFPQTRARWDEALLAYRHNVLTVKAPRT